MALKAATGLLRGPALSALRAVRRRTGGVGGSRRPSFTSALLVGRQQPRTAYSAPGTAGVPASAGLRRAPGRLPSRAWLLPLVAGLAAAASLSQAAQAEGAPEPEGPEGPAEHQEGEQDSGEVLQLDETEGLLAALAARSSEVPDQPSPVQAPAAVWLPHGSAAGAAGGRREEPPPPPAPSLLSPSELASWAVYRAQRLGTEPLPAKLAAYFVVGAPLVAVCAVLYSMVSGKPLARGLAQSFGNLYKVPGATVLGDTNIATVLVNNVTFFLGTFSFALILGIITDEVSQRYKRVREGNFTVRERGHTLVLGHNAQLHSLLRQIAVAQEERGAFPGPVVVLAEWEKHEAAAALAVGGNKLEVLTHRGPPTSTVFLDRAAAAHAGTVIVLAPDPPAGAAAHAGPDWATERQVASLLALKALRERHKRAPGGGELPPQSVVVQSPPADSSGDDIMAAAAGPGSTRYAWEHPLLTATRRLTAGGRRAVAFADYDLEGTMASVMAQSALQPGVASVFYNLVQQTRSGAEVYVRDVPQMEGEAYGDARRRFSDAVVIGLVSPRLGGPPAVRLNPPDTTTLPPGAALVLVAQSAQLQPATAPVEAHPPSGNRQGRAAGAPAQPRHVVLVEWGTVHGATAAAGHASQLLERLEAMLPAGSMVTVVGPQRITAGAAEGQSAPAGQLQGVHVQHLHAQEGLAGVASALRGAGLQSADVVVVLSGSAGRVDADADLIAALALLKDLAGVRSKQTTPLHVIGCVRCPDTIQVANHLLGRLGGGQLTAELLQPDELAAGVLVQLAAEPRLRQVLDGLSASHGGPRIRLHPSSRFALGGASRKAVSFAEVAERAREQGATAVGYILASGSMVLAPRATERRTWAAGDRVVVLE